MRIALDAMGGDFGIEPNLKGALAALETHPELEISLVGDESQLGQKLTESGYASHQIKVVGSDGWIEMEEKPTEALRRKPNCSIAVCWQLMAAREVDAVVSAGHTGAVVAAGLRTRLFLHGVKRPGIAVVLPSLRGSSVLLDVGANPAARPEHLVQYAVMGSIYAREVLGIAEPRVGLMNIGSEDGKGNDLVRETHTLLTESRVNVNYVGNVEGRGIYHGDADVIICEGFVGNVVLKASEGMAEMMMKTISKAVLSDLKEERGLAKTAFENLGKQFAYSESGGAPLLGIDGTCIICHGSSDAYAIANALRVTIKMHDRNLNSQIVAELEKVEQA
jgi:glycerol-3-phosphate acyltransferase PlsX